MEPDKIYSEPTEVDAEDGKVVLDGPDGVAVLMTPEAAEETSHRLFDGAVKAMGQRRREQDKRDRSPLLEGPSSPVPRRPERE